MIGETAIQWAGSRGIGQATLERLRVESGAAQFGSNRIEAIVFGYYRDDKRVNYKARALEEKAYKQQLNGEQRFYNLDNVLAGPKDICFITEGEMDMLSLIECGAAADYEALSVPTGAPSEESDDPQAARKYQYVLDALEQGLSNVGRFILVMDNDDPGRALRADLVSILGAAKCWFINWPEDIKDANEALVRWGSEDLRSYIQESQQEWPIKGIYRLQDIPEPQALELWDCGFPEWEDKIKIAPRTMSVVTGIPTHGKTHFMLQIWFNIAKQYGIKIAVLSAETGIKPHIRKYMRQFFHNKREFDQTAEERAEADAFIEDHLMFIAHPNSRPSFDWVCEMIEVAVVRHECRAAFIDPWNKLETNFDRRAKTETQWIGDCLDELLDMSRAMDIHIQVVAHPSKPMEHKARKLPPGLYDISGSANWNNRVDQGFVVYRPSFTNDDGSRCTDMVLYHEKARFDELGWPCQMEMRLNINSGCFKSSDYLTNTDRLLDDG